MKGVYRFTLDTSSKKFKCPSCGQKRFTKFIDTVTGDYADDIFGRCDREQTCGYFKVPKKGFESREEFRAAQLRAIAKLKEKDKTPPSFVDLKYVKSSLHFDALQKSNFFKAFEIMCGREQLLNACKKYIIGVSKHFGDFSPVFWQIDTDRNVRTAKIMKYDENGKRDKTLEKSFSFAHNLIGVKNFNLKQVFFGSHLISNFETIIIVESEKTAVILHSIFNKILFLATSGSNNFANCLDNLGVEVFNGKNVYILPDKGIEPYWMKIRNENLKDAKLLLLPETAAVGSDALDLVIDLYNRKCEEEIDKICQTEENRRFFDILNLKSRENFNDVLKTNLTI